MKVFVMASSVLGASVTLLGCGAGSGGSTTLAPGVSTVIPTTVTQTTSRTGPPDHPVNPMCPNKGKANLESTEASGGPIPPWTPTGPTEGAGKWCAIQGPPADWNLKNYCPKSNSGAAARIKVLTYNLQWWKNYQQYPKVHGNTMNPAIGANIVKYDKIEPFDIMGMQECEIMSKVIDSAKSQGLSGTWVTKEDWNGKYDGSSVDIGIAYKSETFDYINYGQGFVAEDAPKGTNYYGKRAAQWLRLKHKASGQTVFALNHHGPTAVGVGGVCGGKGTAYQLLKMIADNAQVGDQIFMVGDFNAPSVLEIPPGSGKWQYTEEIGTLACHIPHIYTVPNVQTVWGIDNFFANCATAVTKTQMGKGGSDHWALSVLYEFGGTKESEIMV
jgi:hypothetical protein